MLINDKVWIWGKMCEISLGEGLHNEEVYTL